MRFETQHHLEVQLLNSEVQEVGVKNIETWVSIKKHIYWDQKNSKHHILGIQTYYWDQYGSIKKSLGWDIRPPVPRSLAGPSWPRHNERQQSKRWRPNGRRCNVGVLRSGPSTSLFLGHNRCQISIHFDSSVEMCIDVQPWPLAHILGYLPAFLEPWRGEDA